MTGRADGMKMSAYQNTNQHAKNTEQVNNQRKQEAELGRVAHAHLQRHDQPHTFEHVQAVADEY